MQLIEAARGLAGKLDKVVAKLEEERIIGLHQNVVFCQLGCSLPTAKLHEAWNAASTTGASDLLFTCGISLARKVDRSIRNSITIGVIVF